MTNKLLMKHKLFILLLLLTGWVQGQEITNYTVANTIKNALCNDTVNIILIDKNNNKWIGTHDGVSMYNGKAFVNYTELDGLANNFVNSIATDLTGNIWFGTNGGVSKFDGTKWNTFNSKIGINSDSITSIVVDDKNNVWIGTASSGVQMFNGKNWTTLNDLTDNHINAMTFDFNKKVLWIATKNGISSFDGIKLKKIQKIKKKNIGEVTAIAVGNNSEIWFGNYSNSVYCSNWYDEIWNLYKINKNRISKIEFSDTISRSHSIQSISIDKKSNIYISDGLNTIFRNPKGNTMWIENVSQYTKTIAFDSSGYLWSGGIGAMVMKKENEVTRYSLIENTTFYNNNSGNALCNRLMSNKIEKIVVDKYNNKWILTDKGITKFDNEKWLTFLNYDIGNLYFFRYTDIFADTLGRVIIFSNSTLHRKRYDEIDANQPENIPFKTEVQGEQYIVTKSGEIFSLNQYVEPYVKYMNVKQVLKNQDSYKHIFGTNGGPDCLSGIAKDRFDNIWVMGFYFIANEKGDSHYYYFFIKKDGETIKEYKTNKLVTKFNYSTIFNHFNIDYNENIWFRTSEGIAKYDKVNITEDNTNNGLIDSTVNVIEVDFKGVVWVGTNGGISVFDGTTWKSYTKNNGLIDNKINSIAFEINGDIWVGTDKGFSKITLTK